MAKDAVTGIQAAYSGDFNSAGLGEVSESEYVTYPLWAFKNMLDIRDKGSRQERCFGPFQKKERRG